MKLGKRKLPSGAVTFFLDDFYKGVRLRESLGVVIEPRSNPTVVRNQTTLAAVLFSERQSEIMRARKGIARDSSISLVSFAETLLMERDAQDHVVRVIPYVKEHFGEMELRHVDYTACEAFQRFLSTKAISAKTHRGISAKTVRHYFSALAFILNEAVRGRYLERSPASSVRRVRVADKVVIALTPDELDTLWRFPMNYPAGEAVKLAFFVAANCGLRLGDFRSLRWGSIQTGPEGWRLVKTQDKTGNLVTIPLNQNVQTLLNPRFSLDPLALVFPEFQNTVNPVRYVTDWAKDAGLTKTVTFHTARHTFGTLLAQVSGGNSLLVQNMMGHTTRKMTEHYTQAAGTEARNLVDQLPKVGLK